MSKWRLILLPPMLAMEVVLVFVTIGLIVCRAFAVATMVKDFAESLPNGDWYIGRDRR